MIIDNKYTTSKLKIVTAINMAMIVAMLALYFFDLHNPVENDIYIALISLFSLSYLTILYLKLFYFYINSDGNNIIFRFYTSHPFLRKYKAFEIPKPFFYDYKIEKSFFGLKKDLTIIVKNPNGVFKYPSVSLTAINSKKYYDLTILLNNLKSNKLQ
jgi:hypothetical protein